MSGSGLMDVLADDSGITCVVDDDCAGILCGADADASAPICSAGGQCECVNRANFFYVLGMYQCFIMAIAMYAYLKSQNAVAAKKKDLHEEEGGMTKQEQKNIEMEEHFMATGSYGTVVMALTAFSTIFSGYIVVGVPDEMAYLGFVSFRWLFLSTFAISSWLLIQAQLRNVGYPRHYASPSDIVSDRFNSKALTAAAGTIWTVQLFITITAQVYALHSIIEGLSIGQLHARALTWGICFIILFCEVVGGQRSVSLSDAIQAAIMLVSFIVLPFVLVYHYGTWDDMVDYECGGMTNESDGSKGGCLAYTRPWMVLYPTTGGQCDLEDESQGYNNSNCARSHFDGGAFANDRPANQRTWESPMNVTESVDQNVYLQSAAWNQLNFALFNGGTFGLQPFILQKIFVAKSDSVLRKANMFMYLANFLACMPMLFVGVVYAAKMPPGASAFPAVAGALMNKGGFSEFVAIIASCSAFAALMSTVDSMLISANNVFTVDVLKNWLMVNSSAKALKIMSLIISPIILFGATAWALFDNENINLAYLITLGSSMVWQIAPVLLISFYTDKVTAYPIFIGIVVGFVLAIVFAQEQREPKLTSGLMTQMSGWFSVLANFCTVAIVQLVFNLIGKPWMINDNERTFDKLHPVVLKQFGPERLTAKMINEVYLKGCIVPYSSTINKVIGIACVAAAALACPFWSDAYSSQKIIGGFPEWAFWQFITYGLCACAQVYLVWSWKTAPDDHKAGEKGAETFATDDKGLLLPENGSPEPGNTPPATPPPAAEQGMKRKVSSNKVAPVGAGIEIRGVCGKCGKNVLATQPRTQDDNGIYYHDVCPELD